MIYRKRMIEEECDEIIYNALTTVAEAKNIEDSILNEVAKHLLNICNVYNKQSLKALSDTIGTISFVLYSAFGLEGLQSIIEATERNIQLKIEKERLN